MVKIIKLGEMNYFINNKTGEKMDNYDSLDSDLYLGSLTSSEYDHVQIPAKDIYIKRNNIYFNFKGCKYIVDDGKCDYLIRAGYFILNDGDKYIIETLKEQKKPVILIINKIDKINKEEILLKINEYKDLYDFKEIIPLSALKKNNIDTVTKVLKNYLPDSIKYYEDDMYTNKTTPFIIAETVREKVFNLTDEEVPHSITCVTENIEKQKGSYLINVAIIVDRDSLKKIVIGKHGNMIKEIGTKARIDIEELLDSKVYLELFVKTIPKWRDKEKYLQEFGYNDFME